LLLPYFNVDLSIVTGPPKPFISTVSLPDALLDKLSTVGVSSLNFFKSSILLPNSAKVLGLLDLSPFTRSLKLLVPSGATVKSEPSVPFPSFICFALRKVFTP